MRAGIPLADQRGVMMSCVVLIGREISGLIWFQNRFEFCVHFKFSGELITDFYFLFVQDQS